MAKGNRQTYKKREREMAKKQKQEDKAQRMAARKAGRTLEDNHDPVKEVENDS